MRYQPHDLTLTYEPARRMVHFVLYADPTRGIVTNALNAEIYIHSPTRHVEEWARRLERCEPNPLHAAILDNRSMPELFRRCVEEDGDDPTALATGSACSCYRTLYDPEFGLPVVAKHRRVDAASADKWSYQTYAPLELRPQDTFAALVVDRGEYFWIRTTDGLLSFLPQGPSRGYGVGYSGGGPAELALYIDRLIDSDGRDTAVHPTPHNWDTHPNVDAWTSSTAATRTQELTLDDLRALRHD
ncbi:hypothetical protein ACFZBU_45895 [Embleya sp. NPDC008237]|uniref:hypothetical protein n=1 Tax=Embleya sp. NPDC008237 TaxID=3363978 RepID=UPI0036F0B92B